MTNQEWQERYEITSVKGKIWKRSEVRAKAVKLASVLFTHAPSAVGSAVDSVLDDDKFMRFRRGMVPARVVEEIAIEAFLRSKR